jgi:oxalate decarboxylase/phosphoglucose isomerase-like protein (cupin superfamily)
MYLTIEFGSESKARTFDHRSGDVGYVPFVMGQYIENTGSGHFAFWRCSAATGTLICRSTNT